MYRKRAGHSMRSLADEMAANGHKISHTAISQIENFQRRIDVDELVIIAAYVNASVMALLTPHDDDPDTEVGSAFSEQDTAKAVLYRTYRESPYFPEWVKEEIGEANGSTWKYIYEGAQLVGKLRESFGHEATMKAIVGITEERIREALKDSDKDDNGVD